MEWSWLFVNENIRYLFNILIYYNGYTKQHSKTLEIYQSLSKYSSESLDQQNAYYRHIILILLVLNCVLF